MKKIFRVLLVVMLVMSMVTPAFADSDFVGSINDRPSPELAQLGTTPEGEPYYGIVRDADGEIVMYLAGYEIIVTPTAKVNDATHITDAEKTLHFDVLEALENKEVELKDIEGLTESVKAALGEWAEADDMVIRDFFDIKVVGERAHEVYDYLKNGGTLTVGLNVAISTDKHVEVMSYAASEWQLAVDVVNNGSVLTTTFNHLCPVAVLVEADDIDGGEGGEGGEGTVPGGDSEEQKPGESPETGDDSNPLLWAGICAVAAAGVIVLAKNRKKEQ